MKSEIEQIPPEMYQKLVILSELIIERNNLIEILGEIKRKKTTINEKLASILLNKFLSKIALVDKQLSRDATGLSCSVCQKPITVTDEILACECCGYPGHKDHILNYVKTEGYCPACGEYLKYHYRASIATITHDLFQSCVYAVTDKIPKLTIYYGDKPIEQLDSLEKLYCPACQREVAKDWNFCRRCGFKLEHSQKHKIQKTICPRCGGQVKSSWRFCKLCGQPIS